MRNIHRRIFNLRIMVRIWD